MYKVTVLYLGQKDSPVVFEGLSLEQARCLEAICGPGSGNQHSMEIDPPFPVEKVEEPPVEVAPEPVPEPEPVVEQPPEPPKPEPLYEVVVRNPQDVDFYTKLGLEIGHVDRKIDTGICAFGTVNRKTVDKLKENHAWAYVPGSATIVFVL